MSDHFTIGEPQGEASEVCDPLYGWRYVRLGRCPEIGRQAIQGLFNVCLHGSLSAEARCYAGQPAGADASGLVCPSVYEPHAVHAAPDWDCRCGYYVLREPAPRDHAWKVLTYVQILGTAVECALGWRARQVRVLAAFLPPNQTPAPYSYSLQTQQTQQTQVRTLFEAIGVPVAAAEDALALLRALGVEHITLSELFGHAMPQEAPL